MRNQKKENFLNISRKNPEISKARKNFFEKRKKEKNLIR